MAEIIRLPPRAKPRPVEKSIAVRTQEYIVAEIIEPLLGRDGKARACPACEIVRDIDNGDPR